MYSTQALATTAVVALLNNVTLTPIDVCKVHNVMVDNSILLYECMCKNFRFTDPSNAFPHLVKHATGKTNNDVTSLRFVHATMHYLPTRFAQKFPNIKQLIVERTQLLRLTPEYLMSFVHLKRLTLRDNNVSEILADTFMRNRALEFVSLEGNQLTLIKPVAFDGLVSLKEVRLKGNKCIDQNFDKTSLRTGLKSDVARKCSGGRVRDSHLLIFPVIAMGFIIVVLVIGLCYCGFIRQVEPSHQLIVEDTSYVAPRDCLLHNDVDEHIYAEPIYSLRS